MSHTVNEKYYRDLPIITAADVRLAESVLQMQPGYLPMKPNGDPMFRGSQFNSRINGGQTMATENFFDGAAFGYAVGHQQSHESTPPVEAVQEVKVITTSYSAQYGHTSGGFIEYTSKSGTNTFHGSVYEYFADDAFNARGFSRRGQTPLSNDNFGFTLGGPVVHPEVYNGRNKTFFFTNFDYTRFASGVLPGFGNTTPIDAFKNGDFSALLTGNQIGTDVLGRPIFGGQIFNPATTRLVNGIPVRDPYPGNVIPAGDPLRSAGGGEDRSPDGGPGPGRHLQQRRGKPGGRPDVGTGRAEHHGPRRPQLHAELPLELQLLLEPPAVHSQLRRGRRVHHANSTANSNRSRTHDYYGDGFYQRISTHHAHQQFDWIIRSNLLNHTTVAYDRWFMGGNSLSAGVGWPQQLWGAQSGRPPGHDRRTTRDDLWRQHPLHRHRPELAAVRLPGEQPLAVLQRPDVGEGPAHGEDRVRVPPPRLPVPRLGPGGNRPLQLQSPGHGGFDASGNNLGADRRSVCVLPAGAGSGCPARRFLSSPRSTRRTRRRGSTTSSRSTTS